MDGFGWLVLILCSLRSASAAACRNGIIETGEQCEPSVALVRDCSQVSSSYIGGKAYCTRGCRWDISNCAKIVGACDKDSLFLVCSAREKIKIVEGYYGRNRTSSNDCSDMRASPPGCTGTVIILGCRNCYTDIYWSLVSSCEGRQSCVWANSQSDPCTFIGKSSYAVYTCAMPTWTSSPTATPSSTPSPSSSNTPSASASPTHTVLPTLSDTLTQSKTRSPSATNTLTSTSNRTVTTSRTNSMSPSPSHTDTAVKTASRTWTSTRTKTPRVTQTSAATSSRAMTFTALITKSKTVTSTQTMTTTVTPSPSASFTRNRTGSYSETQTATQSSTSSLTTTPTRTVSRTSTRTAAATLTGTPSGTRSQTKVSTITSSSTTTSTTSSTHSSTITRTLTSTITATRSTSISATGIRTRSQSRTPTPSATFTTTRSLTKLATVSNTPTVTPTLSRSGTRTSTQTFTPTQTLTRPRTRSVTVTTSTTTTRSVSATVTRTRLYSKTTSLTVTPSQSVYRGKPFAKFSTNIIRAMQGTAIAAVPRFATDRHGTELLPGFLNKTEYYSVNITREDSKLINSINLNVSTGDLRIVLVNATRQDEAYGDAFLSVSYCIGYTCAAPTAVMLQVTQTEQEKSKAGSRRVLNNICWIVPLSIFGGVLILFGILVLMRKEMRDRRAGALGPVQRLLLLCTSILYIVNWYTDIVALAMFTNLPNTPFWNEYSISYFVTCAASLAFAVYKTYRVHVDPVNHTGSKWLYIPVLDFYGFLRASKEDVDASFYRRLSWAVKAVFVEQIAQTAINFTYSVRETKDRTPSYVSAGIGALCMVYKIVRYFMLKCRSGDEMADFEDVEMKKAGSWEDLDVGEAFLPPGSEKMSTM